MPSGAVAVRANIRIYHISIRPAFLYGYHDISPLTPPAKVHSHTERRESDDEVKC